MSVPFDNQYNDNDDDCKQGIKFKSGDGPKCIRLRGLPWSATHKEILNFLKNVNVVNGSQGIYLVTSHWDGKNTGEAYVEVESQQDVEEAVKLNKNSMGHRYIEVFVAKAKEAREVLRKTSNHGSTFVVKLRGLPYSVTENQIEDFFKGLEIKPDREGILFVMDRRGRATGEAFVQFENQDDTEQALGRNREKIGHRYIEVFRSSVAEMKRSMSGVARPGPYDLKERGSNRGNDFGGGRSMRMGNDWGGNNNGVGSGNNGAMMNLGGMGGGGMGGGGGVGMGGGNVIPNTGFGVGANNTLGFNNFSNFSNNGNFGNTGFGNGIPNSNNNNINNNGNFGNNVPNAGNFNHGNHGNNGNFNNNGNFGNNGPNNFGNFGNNGNYNNNNGNNGNNAGNIGNNRFNSNSNLFGDFNNFGNNRNFNNAVSEFNVNNRGNNIANSNHNNNNANFANFGNFSNNSNNNSGGNFNANNNGGGGNSFGPIGGGRGDSDFYVIYMRGLPYTSFENDIYKFFDPVRPANVRINFNKKGLHSGTADVYFDTIDDAQLAMQRHNQEMGSRYIELFFDGKTKNSQKFQRRL